MAVLPPVNSGDFKPVGALGAQLVEIEARSASTPGPFGYAFDDEGDDEC